MSENQRYRRGAVRTVVGRIKAGVKVEVGDLLFLGTDEYAYPAASITVNSSGSGSGGGFTGGAALNDLKTRFLGVLIEGATGGAETVDTNCVVGTSGVYEYPVPSGNIDATYGIGHPIKGVSSGSPGALLSQQVQIAANRTDAFAVLASTALQGATTVQIEIFSSMIGNPLA